jgi:hypothetical protein
MSTLEVIEAKLDAHAQTLAKHTEMDAEFAKEIRTDVVALRVQADRIEKVLAQQKGFIGGIVFVVGAIFSALGLAVLYLKG